MVECDFCGKDCDGKLILRDTMISKKDGSDVVLCSDCLNHYASGEYDKIKLKGEDTESNGVDLMPNCSESVYKIDLTKIYDKPDRYEIIDEIVEEIKYLNEEDDWSNWFAIYDEEYGNILLRARWEDEESMEDLQKVLDKYKLSCLDFGDKEDEPLFSYQDKFFRKEGNDVKVHRLNTSSGSKKANEMNKQALKRYAKVSK